MASHFNQLPGNPDIIQLLYQTKELGTMDETWMSRYRNLIEDYVYYRYRDFDTVMIMIVADKSLPEYNITDGIFTYVKFIVDPDYVRKYLV